MMAVAATSRKPTPLLLPFLISSTGTAPLATSSPKRTPPETPLPNTFSLGESVSPCSPLVATQSITSKTSSAPPASLQPTPASFATTLISIPLAVNVSTPTHARKTTSSKARSATPKPAMTTSAHATTPTASAAGSPPIGPLFPPPSPTPISLTPKPSTSTPWSPTTPNPSPTSTATMSTFGMSSTSLLGLQTLGPATISLALAGSSRTQQRESSEQQPVTLWQQSKAASEPSPAERES